MALVKNEHREFVGLDALKAKQALQLSLFEEWAEKKDWRQFHESHYDWWMFPYSKPSRLGFAYVVYESEIHDLKLDPVFIQNYLRGAELLLLSWGWNLQKESLITHPGIYQEWQHWPIRLYKCACSLQEFGFMTVFNSIRKYGVFLLKQGNSFEYNGRDLSQIFI